MPGTPLHDIVVRVTADNGWDLENSRKDDGKELDFRKTET